MDRKTDGTTYTPKEIMMATGMSKTTFINRVRQLRIEMTGQYTFEQAYAIISYVPRGYGRASKEKSDNLRTKLTERLKTDGSPITIRQNKNGQAELIRKE